MPDDRSSRRVWEIDLIRLLTFTAVISVHSLAFTQQPANAVAGGFMMLLQFGREVFFAITGFVLVYSAAGKNVRPLSFWRRRVPYVAVPYLVWSAIYYEVNVRQSHGGWSWATFGHDLIYGGAEYHLYFLVVTLQLYLAFPLLVRFLRATAKRAGTVLVLVGAANLAWFAVLQYAGAGGWIFSRAYELLPTYSIYVLAGGYAALHRDTLDRYLVAYPRRILALSGVAGAIALSVYAWQLGWMAPRVANAVTQPAMVASSLAAVLALSVLARRWVAVGLPWRRAVVIGSEISFGVYLAHPLILTLLLNHGLGNGYQVVPSPLATVLALFGAIAGASLLALAARRTPFALALIGRRAIPAPGVTPAFSEVSAPRNRPLISNR
jgi:peptidoglycan/LPS O-acetylase OafA/YrhL